MLVHDPSVPEDGLIHVLEGVHVHKARSGAPCCALKKNIVSVEMKKRCPKLEKKLKCLNFSQKRDTPLKKAGIKPASSLKLITS